MRVNLYVKNGRDRGERWEGGNTGKEGKNYRTVLGLRCEDSLIIEEKRGKRGRGKCAQVQEAISFFVLFFWY